jgi:GNAT superfamily N-acetyltransferase
MIRLRPFTIEDVPAGLALCRSARWNQIEADWLFFLRRSPGGVWIAERDGAAAGSVATLPYGNQVAWISMLLVFPEHRGQGVGTALLERAMRHLESFPAQRLDATPAGEPIYRQAGFRAEFPLMRLTREAGPGAPAGTSQFRHSRESLAAAADAALFGVSRDALLQMLAERAPQYAREWRAGHCWGRDGHDFHQIGPIAAPSEDVAAGLVSDCLGAGPDRRLVIDVPHTCSAWVERLQHWGFRPQRPFLRMVRGTAPAQTTAPEGCYAIAGPEYG